MLTVSLWKLSYSSIDLICFAFRSFETLIIITSWGQFHYIIMLKNSLCLIYIYEDNLTRSYLPLLFFHRLGFHSWWYIDVCIIWLFNNFSRLNTMKSISIILLICLWEITLLCQLPNSSFFYFCLNCYKKTWKLKM